MYPEDRVLVAYMPSPADFRIVQEQGWYRIPQKHMPKGLYAEYFAFYFGRRFGSQKWAVHYYAEQQGHELVTRAELLPDETAHPRAQELYYKVQLGSLQRLERPIISLRWRRVTFIHTTWDRFKAAVEINDLFVEGGHFVDRLYATLKDRGIRAERNYEMKESGADYDIPLVVLCRNGRIDVHHSDLPQTAAEVEALADRIERETAEKGGVRPS